MTNKHVRRCSPTYVIREMQIKTTRYTRLLEWPKSKTLKTPNAAEDVEQQELSSLLVGMQHEETLGKTVQQFQTKPNLPYNLAIVLLGIYPKKLKTYNHTKPCTLMFITALFITPKTWKQPRCPSVGKLINWGTSIQWYIIQH